MPLGKHGWLHALHCLPQETSCSTHREERGRRDQPLGWRRPLRWQRGHRCGDGSGRVAEGGRVRVKAHVRHEWTSHLLGAVPLLEAGPGGAAARVQILLKHAWPVRVRPRIWLRLRPCRQRPHRLQLCFRAEGAAWVHVGGGRRGGRRCCRLALVAAASGGGGDGFLLCDGCPDGRLQVAQRHPPLVGRLVGVLLCNQSTHGECLSATQTLTSQECGGEQVARNSSRHQRWSCFRSETCEHSSFEMNESS